MTDPSPLPAGAPLTCANCRHSLDPSDKFCRECGLPTVRQAETQRAVPAAPPDVRELKSALEVPPDPKPFQRDGAALAPMAGASAAEPELTTGGVVRVTSPTQATQMAASTLLMVGLILVFVIVGVLLLFLAFRG